MPSRETVKKAMLAIKRAADYEYFFEQLKSPAWIEPLEEEGLFRDPFPPVREGGYISFPMWPQSKYLARMAPLAPETVLNVALKIGTTENVRVHEDLIDAALAMPAAFAVKMVPSVVQWVEFQYQLLLPQKAGELVVHLAEAGEVTAALELMRAVLSIREEVPPSGSDKAILGDKRPHPKFEAYFYEEIAKKCVPPLARAAGRAVVTTLADILTEAVAYEFSHTTDGEDYSSVWRQAIEDEEDVYKGDVDAVLVTAVRDAAEQVIRQSPDSLDPIVSDLEARPWKVFKRIAVHLVRVFANEVPHRVRMYLFDTSMVEDPRLDHEMWLLARDGFTHLPADDKQRYLELIQSIELAQRADDDGGHWPADRLNRYYLYRRLHALKNSLSGTWLDLYQALMSEFGELEHPEFLSYSGGVWVGPTSPKDVNELSTMTVDAAVEFLRSWKPSGDSHDHSAEGLGRTLSTSVAASPERWAVSSKDFVALDPTYVRGLLSGLRDALREKRQFPWAPVIELCKWVMTQPREIPGRKSEYSDLDPGWVWTRKAIADLLSAGLDPGPGTLPYELRTQVWDVLAPLTDDPDPTPAQEARLGGENMDATSLSINTVRGEAMHATIRYALWVLRWHETAEPRQAWAGFDEIPEVRTVLDVHLDPTRDPSMAIRSVYGQWFPWLPLLDRKWTQAALPRIFPSDERYAHLRRVPWEAYVVYANLFDAVFELLAGEYEAAVDRIDQQGAQGREPKRSDRRLAEHIMVLFWRGRVTIGEDGSLVKRFYAKAPSDLRARAFDFVGRTLYHDHNAPIEVIRRLQELWQWRMRESERLPMEDRQAELAEFGWWFASRMFSNDWAYDQLIAVLRLVKRVEATHLVVQRLAELAPNEPLRAVDTLRMLVDVDGKGVGFGFRMQEVEQVLSTVLSTTNELAREKAVDLINVFAAMGIRDYDHLIPSSS